MDSRNTPRKPKSVRQDIGGISQSGDTPWWLPKLWLRPMQNRNNFHSAWFTLLALRIGTVPIQPGYTVDDAHELARFA